VLDTTLCNKVCQWLAAGQWFSRGPVSSTEILLKAALNTITHTINQSEPAPARESLIWKSNGYIKSLKIPKGQLEAVNQRTDNTMGKGQTIQWAKDKGTINDIQNTNRKLNIEQHEPH